MNNMIFDRLESVYLNPPEDTRRRVGRCADCKDPILEDDEVYEILGYVFCESCINDAYECAAPEEVNESGEAVKCFECDSCGKAIMEDDGYYHIKKLRICESCMEEACDCAESEIA